VAQRQGQVAARNMLGAGEAFDQAPFFWSAHYDVSINYVGHAEQWDRIDLDGDPAARDCIARFIRGDKTLAAASIFRDEESLNEEIAWSVQSPRNALMPKTPEGATSSEVARPSYRAAAVVSLAVLLLYVLTLGTTTALWTPASTSRRRTSSAAAPAGKPRLHHHRARVLHAAHRSNGGAAHQLLAALASAATAGIWFLVAERVLSAWFVERWQR
jgi:hypothetical protein